MLQLIYGEKIKQINDFFRLTYILNIMLSHSHRSYASAYTYYCHGSQYQLWGHLDSVSLLLQLRTFLPDGTVKIFKTTVHQIVNQNTIINYQNLFEELKTNAPIIHDPKTGVLSLEMKKMGFLKKGTLLYIKLTEIKNEPSLDNWMLINLYKQKYEAKDPKQNYEGNWSTEDQVHQYLQPKPIYHQNDKYQFSAELDIMNREISTELVVKGFEKQNRLKDKCYKSTIREKDWSQDYKKQFIKIENLFEHLTDPNNYEVSYTKGLIKIRNQPQLKGNVEFLKKSPKFFTERKESVRDFQTSRFKKNLQTDIQFHKNTIQKDLMMKRQLSSIQEKLQNKLLTYIKSSDKQLNNRQKQSLKRYSSKIWNMEKEMKKQLDKMLRQQVENLRQQTKKAINQMKKVYESRILQGKANMRKSHFFFKEDTIQKKEEMVGGKFLVDSKSQQINNFDVGNGTNVIYKGTWDWTQLFTNLKIDFNQVYEFKIKIKSTLFSAIAIGASAISNCRDRSSLAKKDSVSYWGDGQIWEKQKIREEGSGFKVGDTVTTKIDRSKGEITWLVNGAVQSKYKSQMLCNKLNQIYAYFEMYDQGDQLQLLSYQII